ncbi:MAG: hypothetical protein K6E78_04080 [Treponema sp.]|nr:hypothetical protein [Treponema sp.]
MKKILLVLAFVLGFSSCKANKIETYKHNQSVSVSNQKIKVYTDPFTTDMGKVSYITKKVDVLKIESVLFSNKIQKSSLKINLDSGLSGYIPLSSNPYKGGNFSFKEKINVNGKILTILNLVRNYTIEGFSDSPRDVLKLPYDSSECLYSISNDKRVSTTCITSDYKWIYITTDSGSGWIKTDYIHRGIGGPVLWTPEECINEELVWAHER